MNEVKSLKVGMMIGVCLAISGCLGELGTPLGGLASSAQLNNPVVDTNQISCFDDRNQISCPSAGTSFYGQDAQYTGNTPAYVDNGDGTVTDMNTGLMWIQDAGDKMTYSQGINGANSFSFAGYEDWRVPSIKELYSLMDFTGTDPSSMTDSTSNLQPFLDSDIFDFEYGDTASGERVIDSQWITSNIYVSTVMNNQQCFFGVNFADGRIKCYPTRAGGNNGYFVRYVRGDSFVENDFVDNSDGTITDASGSLMWQQSDSGSGMDWPDALNYCETLDLASFSDWRLPNAKELQYIVDYTRSPDATNSAAIDPIFSVSEIVNEAGQRDFPFYWTSTTHIRSNGMGNSAVYIAFGRALGFMNNQWIDVHGAGAQRSDPKIGSASEYPSSRGPQGDVTRVFNYARCVRDA